MVISLSQTFEHLSISFPSVNVDTTSSRAKSGNI
jgi:hypothetical protein